MVQLLVVARDQRVVRCSRRRRRVQLYDRGQLLGSLMRHLCGVAAIEVAVVAPHVLPLFGPFKPQVLRPSGAA
jgi:hypothetical protein